VKVEYQYIDLGSGRLSATQTFGRFTNTLSTNDLDHTYNTVRAGIDCHLYQDYVPLK